MSDEKESIGTKLIALTTNFRFWILVLFLIISHVAIGYTFDSNGASINGVTPNSPAENAGISFDSNIGLRHLEEVLFIGNTKIDTLEDYYEALLNVEPNSTIRIITDQNPAGYSIEIGNFEGTVSDTIGLSVREKSSSNIRLGIELEGGSRLILSPTDELTPEVFDQLVNNLQSRLDVYGASGTKVNKLEDAFSNEQFVIVESINSNKNDIFELIKRQGNFEAKIDNQTAFTGENVLRVDPASAFFQGCSQAAGGFQCTYAFSIEIDSAGGDGFFNIAKDLDVRNGYLSEDIFFYLDGEEITSLNVASSFKFNKITNPQITVSGNAFPTEERAIESAQKEMRFLQAILSTQSLPSELDVVQSYSISSSLGKTLLDNAVIVGLAALIIVSSVIAIRYRHPAIFVGIFVALGAEVLIVFGLAAFLKLSIDLAAIGGLIAAIGTGVDDQVIITDEYFRKKNSSLTSRKKIKNAIYIIMIAYFTTLAAMVPLYFAGLKILQGFAFMIIIGVTVGVLITRPFYAAYLRTMMTTKQERRDEDDDD